MLLYDVLMQEETEKGLQTLLNRAKMLNGERCGLLSAETYIFPGGEGIGHGGAQRTTNNGSKIITVPRHVPRTIFYKGNKKNPLKGRRRAKMK